MKQILLKMIKKRNVANVESREENIKNLERKDNSAKRHCKETINV